MCQNRGVLRRACLVLTIVSLLAPASAHASGPSQPSAAGRPSTLATKPAEIVGGGATQPCEWPQVAALTLGGLCTATLVHPKVIVYAAHCGTLHTHVRLGEQSDAPARELPLLRCERASDLFAVSSMDFSYCELVEPVQDVPITPLLFGCEEGLIDVGTSVTIVGFGEDADGVIGTKRVAQTAIVNVLTTIGIGGMGTGADKGDSGGPAFVQVEDGSWRVLGIVSGGGGDGGIVQYVPAPVTVGWIEERSGIDLTPCHSSDGSWAPTPECGGFFVGSEGGSWESGCNALISGYSAECGESFSASSTDSIAPFVEIVAPTEEMSADAESIELDVEVDASDVEPGWGLREVRLELDGQPWLDVYQRQASDQVAPFEFAAMQIDVGGEHELVAVAEDWAGNVSRSAPVLVHLEGGAVDTTGDEETGDDDAGEGDEMSSKRGCAMATEPGVLTLLIGLGLLRRRQRRVG